MRRNSFALVLVACLTVPVLAEQIVFEQLPTGYGFYSDLKSHPSFGLQIEADSFQMTEPMQLTRIEFWGSLDSDYFDAFRIRVFTDASALPGTEIFNQDFTGVANVVEGAYRRYSVALPAVAALELEPLATYWVSVAGANAFSGTPSADEIFYWSVGDVVGYAREFALTGPWQAAAFAQPAFRLHGEPITAVDAMTWSAVHATFR